MKKYLVIVLLLLVGFSACRKKHFLPEIKAFNQGMYIYSLTIDGKHYKDAIALSIQKDTDTIIKGFDPKVTLSEKMNYEIPELNNIRLLNFKLFSYLSDMRYSVFNAGLYKRNGGGFLAPDHHSLRIPSFDYDIDHISFYLVCIGDHRKARMERPFNINVDGKNYEVYKMKLPAEFDCQNNRQHTIYVDKNYGIVRYMVEDIETEALIYQLDFSHYKAVKR